MRIKTFCLTTLCLFSLSVSAANDVYGTVDQLITRSGANGDHAVYFRIEVMKEHSNFETCIANGDELTWQLDLSSPVAQYQFDILKKSYSERLPVRIIGHEDVCANGEAQSDKIFELSPWSWSEYSMKKVAAPK
ncbi:hypothetical protein HUZ36_03275 [Pseudoalteromonas sp. McH1-7]|uniref:hypothetical protein n=1 Tax=Pseudoalteromonas sp. McH1-7 TaxID=2745574 RepID=UPI0015901783|nr:hypothetical protein [Pseudoalteromonas sp. McH1-7]NUZ09798.1 hypothetical protein [Pseudoalteromonas sp. McH1-7]